MVRTVSTKSLTGMAQILINSCVVCGSVGPISVFTNFEMSIVDIS